MKINLKRVHYMPKILQPGVLYVSEEFGSVAHLCVCGCGAKIRTPLGPTEWTFEETDKGPTLWPSVGNWQQSCQSHYFIYQGEVIWCDKWTSERIEAGHRREEDRRRAYYDNLNRSNGIIRRFWILIKGLFRKM